MKGITRVVIPVGPWVLKFPRLWVGQENFLLGCLGNIRERKKTKWGIYEDLISPCLWCGWLGMVAVQKRVQTCTSPLPETALEKFKDLTIETKHTNYGYLRGKLVCIDYGE